MGWQHEKAESRCCHHSACDLPIREDDKFMSYAVHSGFSYMMKSDGMQFDTPGGYFCTTDN